MPESPKLTPFDVEEKWLNAKVLTDKGPPHPVTKTQPGNSTRESSIIWLLTGVVFFWS